MSLTPMRILLEVCAGSAADIEAAVAAGADRVELCSAPELGGLTPSIGLVEAALAVSQVPVIAMLRPRAGGFCYDRHEFAAMLRDAERFLGLGVSGVVFGILDGRGRVDMPRSRELVECAGPNESVFHRAFDFVSDKCTAMDNLNDGSITGDTQIELCDARFIRGHAHRTVAAEAVAATVAALRRESLHP